MRLAFLPKGCKGASISTLATLETTKARNQKEDATRSNVHKALCKGETVERKKNTSRQKYVVLLKPSGIGKTCYSNTLERKKHFSKSAVTHPCNMKCYQVDFMC